MTFALSQKLENGKNIYLSGWEAVKLPATSALESFLAKLFLMTNPKDGFSQESLLYLQRS